MPVKSIRLSLGLPGVAGVLLVWVDRQPRDVA
jgi:hypothetical protein